MKLVLALVDVGKTRHEHSDFTTQFLGKLRQITPHYRGIGFFREWHNTLIYK